MSYHYKYIGFDELGNKIENTFTANSYEEAHEEAKQRVHILIELESVTAKSLGVLPEKLRLPLEQKALFFKELAMLLESGIILSKSLSLLSQSLTDYPKLTALLQLVVQDLESGKSFSESIEAFPNAFDDIAVGLIRVSETTGNMATTLTDLADYYQFNLDNKRKITQSMTYPAVVFAVSLLAIYIILDFVLPNMTSIFTGADQIPVYTEVLLNVSNGFQEHKLIILSGMAVIVGWLYTDIKLKGEDAAFVKLLVRMPMIKGLLAKFELIRFHSTMQVMLSAGIQVNKALELVGNVVITPRFKKQLVKIETDIAQGGSFTKAMERSSMFSALSIGLIDISEQTGNMAAVFSKLAEREKVELNTKLEKFIALLEPVLILFLGGFIGSVVVVMILSIISTQNVAL